MKILSAKQIKSLDAAYIETEHISSLALMEQASVAFVNWFVKKYDHSKKAWIFCGPGNNGGDGLVIARLLHQLAFQVEAFTVEAPKYTDDHIQNKALLQALIPVKNISNTSDFPEIQKDDLVIDALFGIGISKPLEGIFAAIVNFLNKSKAEIIAVDIASGLLPDTKSTGTVVIKPTWTVTFQLPKLIFMLPHASNYVGKMEVIDIGISEQLIHNFSSLYTFIDEKMVKPLLKKRTQFEHKGSFGRALIIAGNYGMIGAAVLATEACYRTGAGLVRSYVPGCGLSVLQTAVPEAMVLTDESFERITDIPDLTPYNAIGIGPAMNEEEGGVNALRKLLQSAQIPLVLDASALNILGKHRELYKYIPPQSILTPHLKEFERMTKYYEDDFERLEALKQFSHEISSIVVLKGAHSAIAFPDGRVMFNSTGNPGMATGGSGDALTGIITGLLAQSYTPEQAAILGVFIHGYAGDIAAEKRSQQSMMARDIIDGIADFYKAFIL